METVTLKMPLEATADINPINSSGVRTRGVAGVTAGVTEAFLID